MGDVRAGTDSRQYEVLEPGAGETFGPKQGVDLEFALWNTARWLEFATELGVMSPRYPDKGATPSTRAVLHLGEAECQRAYDAWLLDGAQNGRFPTELS